MAYRDMDRTNKVWLLACVLGFLASCYAGYQSYTGARICESKGGDYFHHDHCYKLTRID